MALTKRGPSPTRQVDIQYEHDPPCAARWVGCAQVWFGEGRRRVRTRSVGRKWPGQVWPHARKGWYLSFSNTSSSTGPAHQSGIVLLLHGRTMQPSDALILSICLVAPHGEAGVSATRLVYMILVVREREHSPLSKPIVFHFNKPKQQESLGVYGPASGVSRVKTSCSLGMSAHRKVRGCPPGDDRDSPNTEQRSSTCLFNWVAASQKS